MLACTASVSAQLRRESWNKSKKKRIEGRGGRERRKRLPANPTILKNCVRPQTQLLIGAVLVVLIKQQLIHQSNQVCFVYVHRRSGLIWFVVTDYKCFSLIFIWIMFVRRFIRSKSLRSKVQLEIEQWRLVKANLFRMTGYICDWKKWTVCWR